MNGQFKYHDWGWSWYFLPDDMIAKFEKSIEKFKNARTTKEFEDMNNELKKEFSKYEIQENGTVYNLEIVKL